MLEKNIEAKGNQFAKEKGILHLKFTSPNRSAVPDRILLSKIPVLMRPFVAKYVKFIEYKRTGEQPTPAQKREHERLRALGFTVEIVDTVELAKSVISEMTTPNEN